MREHRGPLWVMGGVLALGAYGFVATFQPDPHFGRILAAYGGIFVAGSLACRDPDRIGLSAPTARTVPLDLDSLRMAPWRGCGRSANVWSIVVESSPERRASPPASGMAAPTTVEEEVRAKLAAELGGMRGSLETAFPLAVFTVAYVVTDEVRPSVVVSVAAAVVAYGFRLAQHSQTRFVRHGLIGILVAAAVASLTGRAEAAFLPGIVQSGVWALLLGVSLVVRWPLAGFVVGSVLDDLTGWRDDPGIVRLSNRLTLVLLAPMVIRLAVQLPLYVAGEVAWLGASRVLLGWPLHAATLALAGLILVRGNTPRHDEDAGTV